MDCCEEGINNLGCWQSCDVIEIGVLASQTGVYTIELQPTGTQIFQTTNTAGTPLVFSNGFNEDGISVFKILQPDGTYLSIDGVDCFQIQNSVAKNPALADVDVEPVECVCTYDIQIQGVFSQQVTLTNCEDLTINIV